MSNHEGTCVSLADNLAIGGTLVHYSSSNDFPVGPVEVAPQQQYQTNEPGITEKSFLYYFNDNPEVFEEDYEIDSNIGNVFVKGRLRKTWFFGSL